MPIHSRNKCLSPEIGKDTQPSPQHFSDQSFGSRILFLTVRWRQIPASSWLPSNSEDTGIILLSILANVKNHTTRQ